MNTRNQAHKPVNKKCNYCGRLSKWNGQESQTSSAVAEIWRFFDFSRWRPPPSGIFKMWNFNDRTVQGGQTASPCQIWSKSVKPRPTYGDFSIFQDGGRPPSWICYVCVRTTNEGHLMVFIAVQNLIGIDAVVFITCMFFDFASLAWRRLFTPPNWFFWGFHPQMGSHVNETPQGTSLREFASTGLICRWVPKKGINK